MMLNKIANCPNPECDEVWDDGEINSVLANTDVFGYKEPDKVNKIAEDCYGWTQDNRKHFTKTSSILFEDGTELIRCPACRNYFDVNTGEEFTSLNHYNECKNGASEQTTE